LIVIDAGTLARVLVERSRSADAIRERLAGEALYAPSLIDAEVLGVLRGLNLGGTLPQRAATVAVSLLATMPMQRVPMPTQLARAWQLSERYNAYAAVYVAVAETLGCPLLTSDARLSRSDGPNATCAIELFP
jgi:predicted nucleic acid-binding protein